MRGGHPTALKLTMSPQVRVKREAAGHDANKLSEDKVHKLSKLSNNIRGHSKDPDKKISKTSKRSFGEE